VPKVSSFQGHVGGYTRRELPVRAFLTWSFLPGRARRRRIVREFSRLIGGISRGISRAVPEPHDTKGSHRG
jgi:hypothetical protein